jgi:cyclin B
MKFRLLPETLYLCVNIIDRYLSHAPIARKRLQLVGVTSLLIACKYEEIYPPEVKDCVYITDRAYTRQDVLDMEAHIVKILQFKMTVPTGYPFLQRFLHITKATRATRNLACFYMERMLQEYCTLNFRPSHVAAAAVSLALNNPDLLEHEGHNNDEAPGVVSSGIPRFPSVCISSLTDPSFAVVARSTSGLYWIHPVRHKVGCFPHGEQSRRNRYHLLASTADRCEAKV